MGQDNHNTENGDGLKFSRERGVLSYSGVPVLEQIMI